MTLRPQIIWEVGLNGFDSLRSWSTIVCLKILMRIWLDNEKKASELVDKMNGRCGIWIIIRSIATSDGLSYRSAISCFLRVREYWLESHQQSKR